MYQVHMIDGGAFSVGKIVCLGRNYVEHIRELGNEIPERPVIFTKPATSIIGEGGRIRIPSWSRDCHHEVELAVLIGTGGREISRDRAMDHVAGYGVAIDLTLRDIQSELKAKGLPWDIAKGFDTACPLSAFVPAEQVADPHDLGIRLRVNDDLRQDGHTGQMMRRIPQIIEEISAIFTLEPGDLVLTGTPSGVGPLRSGDRVVAEIDQVGHLEVSVA
ncbi:5-carboxymethyl-2-hydroxymuconate isomerase [Geothermobacter ehrlichii]|uniref:5-carboxymethyl-2-hydroxymuconate isomerase n=1 Tax=Geothermobacter ehrlichii TaxID=213224 RepID=A0A5D3WJ46_9BACT|nr:fumarylacetoacetate hydrolase family protein [Geothermobacter ehrlichii]TYO96388.1 5-carboxymethyl-2-hydroxymuconate isomerase [Geothermobacter ehrlichii]